MALTSRVTVTDTEDLSTCLLSESTSARKIAIKLELPEIFKPSVPCSSLCSVVREQMV